MHVPTRTSYMTDACVTHVQLNVADSRLSEAAGYGLRAAAAGSAVGDADM